MKDFLLVTAAWSVVIIQAHRNYLMMRVAKKNFLTDSGKQ